MSVPILQFKDDRFLYKNWYEISGVAHYIPIYIVQWINILYLNGRKRMRNLGRAARYKKYWYISLSFIIHPIATKLWWFIIFLCIKFPWEWEIMGKKRTDKLTRVTSRFVNSNEIPQERKKHVWNRRLITS